MILNFQRKSTNLYFASCKNIEIIEWNKYNPTTICHLSRYECSQRFYYPSVRNLQIDEKIFMYTGEPPHSNECRTAETAKSTAIFWQYILWELFREIADCSNILKLSIRKKNKFKYNKYTSCIKCIKLLLALVLFLEKYFFSSTNNFIIWKSSRVLSKIHIYIKY